MTDRRHLWGGEPVMPIGAPPGPLSDAFIAEQDRMRSTRAIAVRGLQQRRWRRRVLPPLAVTSAALLGTGAAGAWVNAELTARSAPPAAPDASGQLAALEQVRQQLSADQQALADITVALRPATANTHAARATTSAPAPGPATLPAARSTSPSGAATVKAPTPPTRRKADNSGSQTVEACGACTDSGCEADGRHSCARPDSGASTSSAANPRAGACPSARACHHGGLWCKALAVRGTRTPRFRR